MPYNDCMMKSLSIAQVSAISGLSIPTLRFYEQEGLIDPVPRDGAGNRMYGENEMARINTIRCLRSAGLTLPQMKRYFSTPGEGEDSLRIRREILLSTQESLAKQAEELRRCRRYLSLKIEHYDLMLEALSKGEKPPAFNACELNKLFSTQTKR